MVWQRKMTGIQIHLNKHSLKTIFSEHIPCVRDCYRCWGHGGKQQNSIIVKKNPERSTYSVYPFLQGRFSKEASSKMKLVCRVFIRECSWD